MGGCFSEPATAPNHANSYGGYPAGANAYAGNNGGKPKPGPYYTAPPMNYATGYPAGGGQSAYMSPSHSSQQYPPMGPAPSYPGAYPPQQQQGYPQGYPPPGYAPQGYPPPVGAMPPQGQYGGRYGQPYGQPSRYGRPGGMGMGGGALLGGGAGLLGGLLIADAITPDYCGGGDYGGGDMGGGDGGGGGE